MTRRFVLSAPTNSATASLHPLQLRILQRGVDLLRPGGRIVYSTCSINPLENEAVVAEILRKNQGMLAGGLRLWVVLCPMPRSPLLDPSFFPSCTSQGVIQLLDMSAALPGLVRRPGISSWKMMVRGRFMCTAGQ